MTYISLIHLTLKRESKKKKKKQESKSYSEFYNFPTFFDSHKLAFPHIQPTLCKF